MRTNGVRLPAGLGFLLCALLAASAMLQTGAITRANSMPGQAGADGVSVGPDDIGGVVTSPNGPEAGVWVIAETSDLQTKYRKIVVTDDHGRYLLPQLPKANYKVFVRGYGLVDSSPVNATPGKTVALTAVIAPNPQAAADIYPPNYWMSLLKIPPKDAFPMPNPGVSSALFGINNEVPTQAHWIDLIKSGCQPCHQIGNKITREMPKNLGTFHSTKEAWERRMRSGQLGAEKTNSMQQFGYDRGIAMFADWTDRITAGEVPLTPPRPQGIERNVVLTLWDVGTPKSFFTALSRPTNGIRRSTGTAPPLKRTGRVARWFLSIPRKTPQARFKFRCVWKPTEN